MAGPNQPIIAYTPVLAKFKSGIDITQPLTQEISSAGC